MVSEQLLSEVEKFKNDTHATMTHDMNIISVYFHSRTTWISYDDPIIVTNKIKFALELGLHGYFF